MSSKSDSISKSKRHRIHKRTLVLTFLLVIVPWCLIAIPGEGANSARDGSRLRHGWPFTHYDSIPNRGGGMGGGGMGGGGLGKPTDEQINTQFASMEEDDHRFNSWLGLYFDLRLKPSDGVAIGFWSNTQRWPWRVAAGKMNWLGLILNLAILSLAAFLFGSLLEFRIARFGRLFRFSLWEFAAFVFYFSILLVWLQQLYRQTQNDYEDLDRISASLSTDSDDEVGQLDSLDGQRLPQIVSELIDHRSRMSDLGQRWFERPTDVWIWISSDFRLPHDPQERHELIASWNRANYPIELTIDYSMDSLKLLAAMSEGNITELDFYYDRLYGKNSLSSIDNDFQPVSLPYLKSLNIRLRTKRSNIRHDQDLQLEVFSQLPRVCEISISNIDNSGAKYLIRTHWPANTIVECSSEVSAVLEKQLKQKFPMEKHDVDLN